MSERPEAPAELTAEPTSLSELAKEYALSLVGPDREIVAFGTLASRSAHRERLLTYAKSAQYLNKFFKSDIAACVTHQSLLDSVPSSASLLVTSDDPVDAFYTIFSDLVRAGRWASMPEYRGTGTYIAGSANIHPDVVIGDDCVVMDNAVIMPRTHIGDRVMIKPNATIGGEGFQLSTIRGRRTLVPHAGGVVIESDVTIGSQTCIDCGLFGEMTTVGAGTGIDNLVHVAHSVTIGSGCVIVACVGVYGSARIGDHAWLGPQCAINPGVSVGEHAIIGAGSAVVRDVPAQAVAFGVPARMWGWQCICGTRLDLVDARAECEACGRSFDFPGGRPVLRADNAA